MAFERAYKARLLLRRQLLRAHRTEVAIAIVNYPACDVPFSFIWRDRLNLPWSPEDSLVIGISSRALFKLDEENEIYEKKGTEAFIAYQRQHEDQIVEPGVAFPLVK